ncbi:MAG TPA: hypothetical protein VK612_02800 [Pyrinomonadaceae bacterium]|nr:hypothetical protein [Pyrinomonadaceae bacterium]
MFRTTILAFALLLTLTAGTVIAGDCNNDNFPGSYTRIDAAQDVFGDGSAVHQYVYQLNLGSGGSVYQFWTGLPDYQLTFGSGTPTIGSWVCRPDGKLLVTVITSTFAPASNPNVTTPDLELASYFRSTFLFKVNNKNTLTRIQARTRTYAAGQDPTNPTGGTLGALSTTPITYNRLVPSDADLLAP